MTAPARAMKGGGQIVSERSNTPSGTAEVGDRRSAHTVVIPLYYSRGWSGVSPDIYSFIVIYTKRKQSRYTRYRIDSVDYVGYPSSVPVYTRSRTDLEEAIRRGVAEHLGVVMADIRMKQKAMWYVDEHQ